MPASIKKFSQLVLAEPRNSGSFTILFTSDTEITLDRVWQYYVDNENFDEERDSITLIDPAESVDLDKEEQNP